jgi:hypothetical protein
MVKSMLRLTLLVSAIASGTFAATLAFAPAVLDLGQRVSRPRDAEHECHLGRGRTVAPMRGVAKIVDALRHGGECP